MFLGFGGRMYRLPVLPEKLSVRTSAKSMKTEVLGVGEIAVAGRLSLRSVKWSSYLPADSAPIGILKALRKHRQERKAIRLVLLGFDLDINAEYLVESFDYYEKGGEVGDIYYEISLVEYKPLTAKKIELPPGGSERTGVKTRQAVQIKPNQRQSERQIPEIYTVQKKEGVWGVVKKLYGHAEVKELAAVMRANRKRLKGKSGGSKLRALSASGFQLELPSRRAILLESDRVAERIGQLRGKRLDADRISKSIKR